MIKNEEQALEVDPFEGDYGDSTDAVLKNKIVTIRKERPCSFCRRMIKAGERARSMTSKLDGEIRSHTFCNRCLNDMIAVEFEYVDPATVESWKGVTLSKLESIVPPLELCKQIPAGEFEDSVLVWRERIGQISRDNRVIVREPEDISYKNEFVEVNFFPAPTLAEIRRKLQNLSVNVIDGVITVSCRINPEDTIFETARDDNDVTAGVLRLWLRIRAMG